MRHAALLLMAAILASTGCTQQACRPCGPGFLGNIFIPQGFGDVDFRDACREHDQCYCTENPRKCCDNQFRDRMLCQCECSRHPTLCKLQAWEWYWLTRLGGAPGYWECQSGREGGDCGGCQGDCCEAADDAPDDADLDAEIHTDATSDEGDDIAAPTIE